MSVSEIINEVKNLTPAERQQVLEALLHNEEEKHTELLNRLKAKGMLKRIPPRHNTPRNFQPVPIEGKPLSETIIEERR